MRKIIENTLNPLIIHTHHFLVKCSSNFYILSPFQPMPRTCPIVYKFEQLDRNLPHLYSQYSNAFGLGPHLCRLTFGF